MTLAPRSRGSTSTCGRAGEIVCLLGANGAGKTTTINLFLGFTQPTSGSVSVDGVDVQRAPAEARARLAYVPETVMLYKHLSGFENLELFARLSLENPPSRRDLLAMLERVGLPSHAMHRPAGGYSKGMRQKVGIAIALTRRARALLLDEPLSGLDPVAANQLSGTIRDLASEGMAVLMATHDIFRAKDTGHRVGIMRRGRLVQDLHTHALAHQALEKLYLATMGSDA